MISARLQYTALSVLALGAFITGLAQLLDQSWPGAVLGLVLTAVLLYGCRQVRLTAARHQDEQRDQLEALRTISLRTPAEHCGDRPPPGIGHPLLYSECVLRPWHLGSHADAHGMRWHWIDYIPPTTRAQQR
ncbi:hypothetical protein ABT285_09925 [Streptomyces microflavus]|uniref:hypothetical protein n=1 Tax=Streptomyces microflavus TaxID=1919 RepID=UPI00332D0641